MRCRSWLQLNVFGTRDLTLQRGESPCRAFLLGTKAHRVNGHGALDLVHARNDLLLAPFGSHQLVACALEPTPKLALFFIRRVELSLKLVHAARRVK